MKSGQLDAASFVLRAVCAGVPSCSKINPVGSQQLLQKHDNLLIIYKHYKITVYQNVTVMSSAVKW